MLGKQHSPCCHFSQHKGPTQSFADFTTVLTTLFLDSWTSQSADSFATPDLDLSMPGQPSYSTPPPPTPYTINAVSHIVLPLAQTHPTVEGKPNCFSCTLVVPDSVIGHLIGRGGKGLHQVHNISGARPQAFTVKSSRTGERHVSIQGTDQQIGETLIGLGKHLMCKQAPSVAMASPIPSMMTAASTTSLTPSSWSLSSPMNVGALASTVRSRDSVQTAWRVKVHAGVGEVSECIVKVS
ncbi:hypothetical protein D9758_016747 [Tetrapyrgos nigripes]|uniref:K Homology domain-containing protein n=1 Tax=Tetrapyrgos nigripes TaxID=182062 RepID=A0A8H5C8T9_9AGAR|nr:hypothetical protein D9758_016747 [Tetrapyrgos nigripes]